MIKIVFIICVSFCLGLGLFPFITNANQSTIANYYPSPSGNYTKVHLVNKSGASIPCNGTNGGTIFTDPTTGYLEVCKSDGTFASYPGSCFNQYATTRPNPPCPNNYQMVNSTNANFGGGAVISWSCCFTGQGAGSNSNSNTNVTKSGCFSLYSNSPSQPYLCNDTLHGGDANAYDVGCDAISSSDMSGSKPVFKRNCCFNDTLGTNNLGAVSQCVCPNTCGTSDCGTDPCGHSCGTCASPLTCPTSGPGTCSCTPITTCPPPDNCGTIPNGCGGNLSCGNCSSPNICAGGGTANVCGTCTPNPSCGGYECGYDSCGNSCSPGCSNGYQCTELNSPGTCFCPSGNIICDSHCCSVGDHCCPGANQPCQSGNVCIY